MPVQIQNSRSGQATSLSAAIATAGSPFAFVGGSYPGTLGTCGTSLASGATCTITLIFSPTAGGVAQDSLLVSYFDGENTDTATISLKGTGTSRAILSLDFEPLFNFPLTILNTSQTQIFVLSNTGQTEATSLASTSTLSNGLSYVGGSYPGTGGTCADTLGAGATCNLIVTFAPTVVGVATSAIALAFFDGLLNQTLTLNLAGTGITAALLGISDGPTFDYGRVYLGSVLNKTYTITNSGQANAAVMAAGSPALGAPFSFLGGSYPGTGGNCGTMLLGGASCQIVVQFAPTVLGVANDTIRVQYNDGTLLQTSTRAITGTGVLANLTFNNAPTQSFSQIINSTGNQTVTVNNIGLGAATAVGPGSPLFSSPYAFVGGSYPGTGGTCGVTLAASTSCTLVISFSPTLLITYDDTVRINYFDGQNSQVSTLGLAGTGITANLSISDGPTYSYGTPIINTSVDHTFTVTNSGLAAAVSVAQGSPALTAPFSFKGGSYPGTGGTCTATIAAITSCTIVVTYAPTVTGITNEAIPLSYTDSVNSYSASRAVTGTGITATLALSDGPTYDYGSQIINTSTDHTFTVTNSGAASAVTMAQGSPALSAPFSFKGGSYPGTGGSCGATLAPSAGCTLVVTYTPTATVVSNETLTLTYSDSVNSYSVSGGVKGTGITATITISDGATYNYGSQILNTNTDHTFTLTNSGAAGAASMAQGAPALSAPYTFKGGSYPGTGGTCGVTLAASATCTIVVTYTPTAIGVTSKSITIAYTDTVNSYTASRAITGTGITATISISDGVTYNYGSQILNTTTSKTFTLTNSGAASAASMAQGAPALSAPYAFKGGSYPGTGGTCGATLAASATCTIVVTYTPTAIGVTSESITIAYTDTVNSYTASRAITGTGITATISISDGVTYNYGSQILNTTTSKTFTLTNSGAAGASSMAQGAPALSAPYTFVGGSYPGTGGTCGATLAASSTCTIVVTYTPTATGVTSQTITIAYSDSVNSYTTTRPITGTGITASIAISDGATYNYGSQILNTTTSKTFTLTNSGAAGAASMAQGAPALSAPYTFVGGSYPGTGGTCGATLAASATCTIVVTYTPTAIGATSESITIAYTDTVNSYNAPRAITGTGITAAITISDGLTYDYGSQILNTNTDHTFTLTNSGAAGAASMTQGAPALSAPYAFKGGSYPGTGGTCGATLAASATCTIVVTYTPTAIGATSESITIAYTDTVNSYNAPRAITGTGITAAISISDGLTYDYGSQILNTTTSKTFTLTNSGSAGASSMAQGTPALSAPYTFKGGSYPGTGGTCGATLAASGTCTIVVNFVPTATGSASQTITISYSDSVNTTTATRPITGTGITAAISISDGLTYNYGSQILNTTTSKTFTLTNTGSAGASAMAQGTPALSAPYTFLGGSYPGTGGTCSATLAASGTCTIVVTYTPASIGVTNQTITISYSDSVNTTTATRPITGTGITAAISISDGLTYNYGSQILNTTTSKTFTLTNTGSAGASAMAQGTPALSAPYTFLGGSYPGTGGTCSATLAASGTCTIVVTYTPASIGVTNQTITISYSDSVNTTTATRPITGTGITAAISISDGATYNYGTQILTTSTDHTFTLTNTGSAGASSMAQGTPVLSAPFTFKGGSYPGTAGTCGTTLAAAGTCTIVVTYSPTSAVTTNESISISYSDSVNAATASRAITGTGVTAASLSFSDGPTYNFGSHAANVSTNKTFTVTNSGGSSATSIAATGPSTAPYKYTGGAYPGTAGTCGVTLAAAGTCTVVVTFKPTAAGTFNDTVSVSYNNGLSGGQSAPRPVTGFCTGRIGIPLSGAKVEATLEQPDGKQLAVGFVRARSGRAFFAVARFERDGTLDPTFGNLGIVVTAVGTTEDRAYAAALQKNGCILVAGSSDDGNGTDRFALVRYHSDGSLDPLWGVNGRVTSALGEGGAKALSVTVQADGRVVAGGDAGAPQGQSFALARFSGDGAEDPLFNGTGSIVVPLGKGSSRVETVSIEDDGRIRATGQVAVSEEKTEPAQVYLTPGGQIDSVSPDALL